MSSTASFDKNSQCLPKSTASFGRRISVAHSCSDLIHKPEAHWNITGGNQTSCFGWSSSVNELQLIGQCRFCTRDYKCSCCKNCSHLVVIYAPVSRLETKLKLERRKKEREKAM